MKLRQTLTAVAVGSLLAVAGSASALPTLSIVDAAGTPRAATDPQVEHTGDPGGSVYPWTGGGGPGAGIPWRTNAGGGWPNGPGIGPDSSFTGLGTSGWHSSYLRLSESATETKWS